MITVGPETKIATILKANPDAIELIASLSPHFNKLRNPLFRKVFAPRVTVAEAAAIGHCSVDAILNSIKGLGFDIHNGSPAVIDKKEFHHLQDDAAIAVDETLDVREDIAQGKDPFNRIMKTLDQLPVGKTLLLINTFEPLPLIRVLEKKGYEIKVRQVSVSEIYTYIAKNKQDGVAAEKVKEDKQKFDALLIKYKDAFVHVDVSKMEMPWPMMTILDHLGKLPEGCALFVTHRKIPMFLLPQLREKDFAYAIKQNAEGVNIIIYRQADDDE